MTKLKSGPCGDWCEAVKACTSQKVKSGGASNSSSSITAVSTHWDVIYYLSLSSHLPIWTPLVRGISDEKFNVLLLDLSFEISETAEENWYKYLSNISADMCWQIFSFTA